MFTKLQKKLTRRYNPKVKYRDKPKHPSIKYQKPPSDRDYVQRAMGNRPRINMIRRKPRTPQEVKQGYRGLYTFMEYFGGNRQLAADSCGVSKGTIDKALRDGYLSPYVALMSQRIPEMPYPPSIFCPFITSKKEWEEGRREIAGAVNNASLASERMSAYHASKINVR